MDNSLGQIELQILQLLGIVLGAAALWLIKKAIAWIGIRLNADRQAQLASAVDKMMTLGVTHADDIIRQDGWDHPNTKNAVINYALSAMESKFQGTMAGAGVDLTDEKSKTQLIDMMSRMWPDIATRLSVSPVTPPTPALPPIVVAVPAAMSPP